MVYVYLERTSLHQKSCENISLISKAYHKWNTKNILMHFSQSSFNLMGVFKQFRFYWHLLLCITFYCEKICKLLQLSHLALHRPKTVLHIIKARMHINSTLKSKIPGKLYKSVYSFTMFLRIYPIYYQIEPTPSLCSGCCWLTVRWKEELFFLLLYPRATQSTFQVKYCLSWNAAILEKLH